MSDQEASDTLRSRPAVEVKSVKTSPNPAALADKLTLEVDFHLEVPIANGIWDIEYLVDSVMKRHIINILSMPLIICIISTNDQFSLTKNGLLNFVCIQLGQVEATDYARGNNRFQFSTPQINISGIQPSQLTNCGLLIASFKDDAGDILDLKMVIQVSEQREGLQRIIYSPLE